MRGKGNWWLGPSTSYELYELVGNIDIVNDRERLYNLDKSTIVR